MWLVYSKVYSEFAFSQHFAVFSRWHSADFQCFSKRICQHFHPVQPPFSRPFLSVSWHLFVATSLSLCLCLSVCLSLTLSLSLSLSLFLSFSLCLCLSVSLSVCLSLFFYFQECYPNSPFRHFAVLFQLKLPFFFLNFNFNFYFNLNFCLLQLYVIVINLCQ